MKRTSIYEDFQRNQRIAIVLAAAVFSLTLLNIVWGMQRVLVKSRITYLHAEGRTIQIFEAPSNTRFSPKKSIKP